MFLKNISFDLLLTNKTYVKVALFYLFLFLRKSSGIFIKVGFLNQPKIPVQHLVEHPPSRLKIEAKKLFFLLMNEQLNYNSYLYGRNLYLKT